MTRQGDVVIGHNKRRRK
jgi:hypothetical protein